MTEQEVKTIKQHNDIERLKQDREYAYLEMCQASHDLAEAQEQYDAAKEEYEKAYEAFEKAMAVEG